MIYKKCERFTKERSKKLSLCTPGADATVRFSRRFAQTHLLEKDAARDILVQVRGSEEELAPGGAVFESVLHTDGLEAGAYGAGGLVTGEEPKAGADEFFRCGLQLCLVREGGRDGEAGGEGGEQGVEEELHGGSMKIAWGG